MATAIHKNLIADVPYEYDYGVGVDTKWSGFSLYVLKNTKMAANLIEYGFMDYEKEAKKMLDPSYQKLCAEATAKGICEYFGVPYKAPGNNVTTNTGWPNGDYNCKVRTTDNLNLRKGRGTEYDIIYTIPKGTEFELGYVLHGWGSTWDFKGKCGYFNCKYVEKV